MMDFTKYKEINDVRLHYREMEDADVVSSYRNTGCGDGYRLYLKIEEAGDHRVLDASYTTTGCGFGLTALAMACEWIRGKTLADAENITTQDIENLFEFPERRKNYPQSAVEAVQKALYDYRNGTGIKPEDRISGTATLEKLHKQGHLRGENLSQVILEGQDLQGVDFTGANLQNAFLQKSNLEGAILKGVKLRGAFLNGACLRNADLTEADLRWAKLSGADLQGARFDGALFDIGTRLDPAYISLFSVMKKEGKDIYMPSAGS